MLNNEVKTSAFEIHYSILKIQVHRAPVVAGSKARYPALQYARGGRRVICEKPC